MSLRVVAIVATALGATADRAWAEEATGTLHLDAGSYVSYSETENPRLPAGSAIRFRFGSPGADGAIPITVRPGDVSIAPIAVPQGELQYALGAPATGTLRSIAGSRQIELFATLVATFRDNPGIPPAAYELRFTTGTAEAVNTSATESVTVGGTPAAATNFVRLVGAATNRPDAVPGPGEAVYAVLSGTFDWLPDP
jgi:hypothetical protein